MICGVTHISGQLTPNIGKYLQVFTHEIVLVTLWEHILGIIGQIQLLCTDVKTTRSF